MSVNEKKMWVKGEHEMKNYKPLQTLAHRGSTAQAYLGVFY